MPILQRLLILFGLIILSACAASTSSLPAPDAAQPPGLALSSAQSQEATPVEQPVRQIYLDGPLADPESEISSMAWFGDNLIFLPQYPNRFDNNLFYLTKSEILAFLNGEIDGTLTPTPIPFRGEDLPTTVFGYEGLEGVETLGDQIFFTIESRPDAMRGYLLSGEIAPDMSEIRVDTTKLIPIQPQADLANMTDETILTVDGKVITIFEANGFNINTDAVAHVFSPDLTDLGTIPFPNVEYRINDASRVDDDGIFWVINYFWPGDQLLQPIPDPIVARWGAGESHSQSAVVERLLPMRYSPEGITLADLPPVQLELIGGIVARNWEGLVLLDDLGFLLVTDKHPSTILAFVPRNP